MRAINRRKAIAGAKVSIVPSAGAAHYETVPDARGYFQITDPAAGSYSATADADGFKLTGATSRTGLLPQGLWQLRCHSRRAS